MKLKSITQFMTVVACFASCMTANAQVAFVAKANETVDSQSALTQAQTVVSPVVTAKPAIVPSENADPNVYNMEGTVETYMDPTTNYVHGSKYHSPSSVVSSPEVVYQSYTTAPAQSFASAPRSGGFGGGGFGGGGILGGGGGLFRRPWLGLGVAGGIVAIAVSDDDDDASPDN